MCSDSKKHHLLHVLTKSFDEISEAIIRTQQEEERSVVQVVSLAGDDPDYDGLLEAIFTADTIHVW